MKKPVEKTETARSKPQVQMGSKKRFISYAARMQDEHGEDAISIIHVDNGQRIPIDLGEVDGMHGCELELRHEGELLMTTRIGEQYVEPKGVMRDPAMFQAANNSKLGAQVLDSMQAFQHLTANAYKDERANAIRYREDVDRYRDENMKLREQLMIAQTKLEAKDGEDSMMPMLQFAQTAFIAWQSNDFKKELMNRVKVAMANADLPADEADMIIRFLNRPEFTAMGALEMASKAPALDH